MALMQKGVALAAGRMPKKITPRAHAALDYAIAGSFALMGARTSRAVGYFERSAPRDPSDPRSRRWSW